MSLLHKFSRTWQLIFCSHMDHQDFCALNAYSSKNSLTLEIEGVRSTLRSPWMLRGCSSLGSHAECLSNSNLKSNRNNSKIDQTGNLTNQFLLTHLRVSCGTSETHLQKINMEPGQWVNTGWIYAPRCTQIRKMKEISGSPAPWRMNGQQHRLLSLGPWKWSAAASQCWTHRPEYRHGGDGCATKMAWLYSVTS